MQYTRPNISKSDLIISRESLLSEILNYQRSMPIVSHKMNLSNRFMGGSDKELAIEETSATVSPASVQEVSNPPQRSMPIVSHKMNLSNRFMGGSDKELAIEETSATVSPASVQEVSNPPPLSPTPSMPPSPSIEESFKESEQLEKDSQKNQLPANGSCCFCISQTPGSVGDRKVDEIIDYVHQNLKEASKALASLGENFEHDLKLMFIDILGRIKQWTGIVQDKLDTCKNEVDNLRKELLARACEIDNKSRELKNLKAQIAEYQNDLLSHSELPKKGLKRLEKEKREISIHEDQFVEGKAQATNAEEIMRADDKENDEDVQTEIVKQIDRIKKINSKKKTRAVDQGDEEDAQAVRDVDRIDEENKELIRKKTDNERNMKDVGYTNTTVQTVVQEKERTKRESELESEIKWLRKEYDRVMKERVQYENAIQRALLRGVSSLNVEALRVLRCPPIPCCSPCIPCPVTAGIIPPEPVIPCSGKSTKRRPESAAATVNNTKVSRDRHVQNDDQTDCTTKRPSTSLCCSVNKNRKSTNGSMFFLLHQSDAKNLNAPDEVCGSTIMKKIEIPPLPKFGI